MKITLLLLTIGLCNIYGSVFSQTVMVDLTLNNVPLSQAIEKIESKTNYKFLYRADLIDIDKLVNISIKQPTLNELLTSLFKDTKISYNLLSDSLIVLTPLQQLRVTGTITDAATGDPLPGVNVIIKGSNVGVISDMDGKYSIEVSNTDAVLVYSFMGYLSEEVVVAAKSEINIILIADILQLDEVVVVGYGTQKKTTVTGSVSMAKGEDVAKSPVANISNSIAGRVSGVSMRPNGGQPGKDNPDIYIRGIATTGNSAPLIVVDGVIRDNINQIDPDNIENISVLKDAVAVAPYGMGGANGVILITTKSGKSGTFNLTFNTYYGWQTPTVYPKMLSGKDYMTLRNNAYYSATPTGTNPPYPNNDFIDNYDQLHATDPDKYPSSNFYNDVADLYVPLQKYNLQLNGGTEKLRYYAGLGYFKQDGMLEGLGYQRYNYSVNIEANATKTTKVNILLNGSFESTRSTNKTTNDIIWAAVKYIPVEPMVFTNGYWGASAGFSPVGDIKGGYAKANKTTLLSSISVEQQLPFIEGLSVKGVFSYDPAITTNKNWHLPSYFYNIDTTATPYTFSKKIVPGSEDINLYQDYSQNSNITYQGYINYNRAFGKHEITGLFVAEARQNKYNYFNAYRKNYAVIIDELGMGSSDKENLDNNGGSKTGSQIGYVYRLGYNFAGKYLYEMAGRYDGHYVFAPGKRYGYFPSFSAGWRISEENFLKDRFVWLDNLKLRGSWGKSGNLAFLNGALAENQYLYAYQLYSNAYAFGQGVFTQGSYVPRDPNYDITWEVSTKSDVGIEIGLLKGKLNLEFDYFHEDRNNMLIRPSVTVPVEYGLELPLVNGGKMSNNGIEISLKARHNLANGMKINLAGNFSYAKNKMVYTFEDSSSYNNPERRRTGRQIGTQFGYHSLGLFTTDDDIDKNGIIDANDGYTIEQFGVLHPGDIKYEDVNDDKKIGTDDEKVIGYPTYPSITYGFTPSVEWKGFDLSLFFQGAALASINIANFQTIPFMNNNSNASYEYFDNYWTEDRQVAKYPRIYPSSYSNNNQNSDFWIMNTGYLRLKNAVLGYSLPVQIAKKAGMQALRVYFSGQNLVTFSKLTFMDPEEQIVNTGATYFYPNQKIYTIGLDVTF
ncbi:MAG: TonB-dependent receptor [Bacteroidales bacterium]